MGFYFAQVGNKNEESKRDYEELRSLARTSGYDFKKMEESYEEDFAEERGVKQHLNLSEAAWAIVEQDRNNFYYDEKEGSKSGFFNRIFYNFYQTAEASINLRGDAKRGELEELLGRTKTKLGNAKEELIKTYVDVYKKQLISKALSYPKGHGEKFRINVENVNILRNVVTEDNCYDGVVGLYLKALYEEYCEKPTCERESIFFKDKVDEIKSAIKAEKKVKVIIRPKYNSNCKPEVRLICPYDIMTEDTRSYNYLVGIDPKEQDENGKEGKVVCIRISNIERVYMMKSEGAHLSKEKRQKIQKEVAEKKVEYIVGELQKIKVRFTPKGRSNFNKWLYMRPNKYEAKGLIYEFTCTERQAENYFFKFDRDVEILEPESLRTRFIKKYKNALKNYEIPENNFNDKS